VDKKNMELPIHDSARNSAISSCKGLDQTKIEHHQSYLPNSVHDYFRKDVQHLARWQLVQTMHLFCKANQSVLSFGVNTVSIIPFAGI
jgi:hypothetical protein